MTRLGLGYALSTSAGQASAALLTIPLSLVAAELGADGGEGVATALGVVMIAVGVLEGAITGGAQALALRGRVPATRWIGRTALGFGLGWTVGASSSWLEPSGSPHGALVLVLALVHGLVLGALVGLLVAPSIAADRRGRTRVVLGQAIGWGAGLVTAVLATAVASSSEPAVEVALGALRGAAVGLVSGAIAGPFVEAELERKETIGSARREG